MANGLIDIIEPRLPVNTETKVKQDEKYKWIKIYDMRDDVGGNWYTPFQNLNNKSGTALEIIGNKINLKTDRRIDKEFAILHANNVISRVIRYN